MSLCAEPFWCARVRKWIHRVPPSTERSGHALSSGSGPATEAQGCPVQDTSCGLPSLPDLLDDLDVDVDLESLEQLTQSLLQDIVQDLEGGALKTENQEQPTNGKNSFEEVVGPASERLESCGGDGLIEDISQYLLLHHNYSAKRPEVSKKCNKITKKSKKSKNKLKEIKPKVVVEAIDYNTPVVLAEDIQSEEIVYGTFDESTNCLTIILNDDNVVENNSMEVESISSDCGYESLDSPNNSEIEDLFDKSISELFPTLM